MKKINKIVTVEITLIIHNCPFCFSNELEVKYIYYQMGYSNNPGYCVRCKNCMTEGPKTNSEFNNGRFSSDEYGAINLWNEFTEKSDVQKSYNYQEWAKRCKETLDELFLSISTQDQKRFIVPVNKIYDFLNIFLYPHP